MKKIVKILSLMLVVVMLSSVMSIATSAGEVTYEDYVRLQNRDDGRGNIYFSLRARIENNEIVLNMDVKTVKWVLCWASAGIGFDPDRVMPVVGYQYTFEETGVTQDRMIVKYPDFEYDKTIEQDIQRFANIEDDPCTVDIGAHACGNMEQMHDLYFLNKIYTFDDIRFNIVDDECTEFGFWFRGGDAWVQKDGKFRGHGDCLTEYIMIYRTKKNFRPATKEHPASFDWVYTSNRQEGEIGRTTVYYGNPLPSDPEDPPVEPGKYPLGDVNGDEQVNAFDYQMLKAYVLRTYTQATKDELERMDVTGDRQIDAFDYMIVKTIVLGTYKPKKAS